MVRLAATLKNHVQKSSPVAFRVCRHFERSEEHLVVPGGGAGVADNVAAVATSLASISDPRPGDGCERSRLH